MMNAIVFPGAKVRARPPVTQGFGTLAVELYDSMQDGEVERPLGVLNLEAGVTAALEPVELAEGADMAEDAGQTGNARFMSDEGMRPRTIAGLIGAMESERLIYARAAYAGYRAHMRHAFRHNPADQLAVWYPHWDSLSTTGQAAWQAAMGILCGPPPFPDAGR
jgi:hypothetical protein